MFLKFIIVSCIGQWSITCPQLLRNVPLKRIVHRFSLNDGKRFAELIFLMVWNSNRSYVLLALFQMQIHESSDMNNLTTFCTLWLTVKLFIYCFVSRPNTARCFRQRRLNIFNRLRSIFDNILVGCCLLAILLNRFQWKKVLLNFFNSGKACWARLFCSK